MKMRVDDGICDVAPKNDENGSAREEVKVASDA
jgi:hypothetical protein